MTATHARAAGAVDTKSREAPGAKVLRKHCARHRGDSTMTLNELRPGHQRVADIYGLPVNIVRDPLNGKFTAWLGQPGTFGAASGPIVETIVPQKAPDGPPKNSRPEKSNADPRAVSTKSMRAKCVSDFYEPVDCEIQAMTTAIQRGDRGVQLDADFSPGIEIIEGWSVLTEPDIRGALPALQKYARALTRSPIAQLRPCYRQADFERGHAIHGHKKWI